MPDADAALLLRTEENLRAAVAALRRLDDDLRRALDVALVEPSGSASGGSPAGSDTAP